MIAGGYYFIRALQCSGFTNQLAIGAPATVVDIDNRYHLVSHNKCTASANAYTKPAAVAPGGIKDGQNRQLKNLF